jgi:DinB superfamily
MGTNRENGELGDLIEELEAVAADARREFGGLNAAQLNWKPSPEQWSVGQCLEHLIKTNRFFFPALEQVARGEYEGSLWTRVSPLSGFFGRLVLRAMAAGRKARATRNIQPSASVIDAEVVEQFVRHQEEMTGLMRATHAEGLKRAFVTSPIAGFVTYSLFDACRIAAAHERRHFAQARGITEAEGFPND